MLVWICEIPEFTAINPDCRLDSKIILDRLTGLLFLKSRGVLPESGAFSMRAFRGSHRYIHYGNSGDRGRFGEYTVSASLLQRSALGDANGTETFSGVFLSLSVLARFLDAVYDDDINWSPR